MYSTRFWLAIFVMTVFLVAPGGAAANDLPAQSDGEGTFWIQVRLRNEDVVQDNTLEDAHAVTLRTRGGYETKEYRGFQFLIEGESILTLLDDYNSTTNGETRYSVVADPEDTEINRVYLTYTGIQNTSIAVGRQKIILDNSRFVGNVGWRQNEQTFDSVTIVNSSIPDTIIKFAYIDKVRRIFGSDSPIGETDMGSPIINVTYGGIENVALTLYGYFLDFDDVPLNSQRTLGVRLTGSRAIDPFRIDYGLEFANQQNYQGGSLAIDASYYHATLGATLNAFNVGVGYEQLGGDGNYGFQTPLATGHLFGGWADQFLSTPIEGLTDMYFSLGGRVEGVKLKAVYHNFASDLGGQEYGSEIDFIATRKFGEHFVAGMKYANYSANQRGVDTSKFWLFVQFNH